ncbi:hypothetical protein D3C86_2006370 [compost metagenome]
MIVCWSTEEYLAFEVMVMDIPDATITFAEKYCMLPSVPNVLFQLMGALSLHGLPVLLANARPIAEE